MLSPLPSPTSLSRFQDLDLERNCIYTDHKEIYRNFRVVKLLDKSEFSVYLVNSRITKLNYAMKIFECENGKPNFYFKNAIRFLGLIHPNVVRCLHYENKREIKIDNQEMNISYIMMDYAEHGNLMNFVTRNPHDIDDKLIRTYFKQIIEGLEYIHQNGISHMDLKPENLLIGTDYTLKIADFDTAYYKGDALIVGGGTKYYRAPEVWLGKCKDSKAADIYSAGLILFLLKTKGKLPQYENESTFRVNLAHFLHNDVPLFWETQLTILEKNKYFFDKDFKDLFIMMTRFEPQSRATIKRVKESKWLQGSIYSAQDLKSKMRYLF